MAFGAEVPDMVRGMTQVFGPITMHWIAGQSEHTALFRTMSFVKINAFQKGGAYNIQYV